MQPFTFPLTPGAQWENGLLCLPPQGGGLVLSPRDAATHAYLNLTLTVEEDHAMAFELRLWAAQEHPRVIIRFGVMPRYRTRIPLNMGWLDGHILYPGHVPGELKVVCHGSRIAPEEIRRVEWVSMPCFHGVRVRLELWVKVVPNWMKNGRLRLERRALRPRPRAVHAPGGRNGPVYPQGLAGENP